MLLLLLPRPACMQVITYICLTLTFASSRFTPSGPSYYGYSVLIFGYYTYTVAADAQSLFCLPLIVIRSTRNKYCSVQDRI